MLIPRVVGLTALFLLWTLAAGAHAQEPPPTLAAGNVYAPVVYVLSGPAQATTGDTVAFRLDYHPYVPPAGVPTGGGGAVFEYGVGANPSATFVGIRSIAGIPPTDLGSQGTGSERFALAGSSGTVEFLVRPVPGFTGPLKVSTYFLGTGIEDPPGSVTSATTNIIGAVPTPVAPAAPALSTLAPSVTLPGTGGGTARQPGSAWALVVALAVAGLTVIAGGVAMRPRY